MSAPVRLDKIRIGQQASTSDWGTMPGTLEFLEPMEMVTIDPDYNHVERPWQRGNGGHYPAVVVGKMTEGISDISVAGYGLSGGGAGAGVDTDELHIGPMEEVLESVLGQVVEAVGDTFAASPGSGTTLTMDGTPTHVAGGGIIATGNASQKLVAREVVSLDDPDVEIDRALTTDTNVADVPVNSSAAPAMKTFWVRTDLPDRKHLALDGEGLPSFRRRIIGALPGSLSMRCPSGGLLSFVLGGWRFTEWDQPANADPAITTPTRGNLIRCVDSPLWIGGDLYMAHDIGIDFGVKLAPRKSDGAPNGAWGYVIDEIRPIITAKLIMGSLTAPKQVTETIYDSLANNVNGTTQDLAFQHGRSLGGICYARAPAADVKARVVVEDGLKYVQLRATCNDASDVANAHGDYPLRLHFG